MFGAHIYCKKLQHTKETCQKLHGKPQGINHASDFKGVQQQGQVYVADVNNYREKQSKYNTKLGKLNEEDIKKLKKNWVHWKNLWVFALSQIQVSFLSLMILMHWVYPLQALGSLIQELLTI